MLPASFISCYCSRKGLKARRAQIVELLMSGCTNSEIGQVLNLKEQVVKNYLRDVYNVAGVKNRTAIVADVYDMFFSDYEQFLAAKPQFEKFLEVKPEFEAWERDAEEYRRFINLRPKFDSWLSRNTLLKQNMGLVTA